MTESPAELVAHWDAAYGDGTRSVSWTQPEAASSLELVEQLGIGPDTAVIDIGGGASPLTARLLDRCFTDLTVLDISE